MTRASGGSSAVPSWFADALASFERRGCSLLVTGAVPRAVQARAAGRLFGSPTAERKRVLVLTGSTGQPVERLLPTGVSLGDPDVRLVDRRGGARAVTGGLAPTDAGATATSHARLSELQRAVGRALRSCDDGDLDPGTVRCCLASLTSLLDDHEPARVREFVAETATVVEDLRGMAQYHLPVPDRAAAVRSLSPAFDARIELRQRSELVAEHRWHLPDHEPTAWVRL